MAVPLANVDSAWLRMDDATNLMVVTGVLVLDEPVTVEEFREFVSRRLLRFPRFRERILDPHSTVRTPSWAPDPTFAIEDHVVTAKLPEPRDAPTLERFVSALTSTPLDFTHSPWQFHVVPDYQGGTAIVGRLHHCIGDGLALIYVMLSMADGGIDPPLRPSLRARDVSDEDGGLLEAISRAVRPAVKVAVSFLRAVLQRTTEMIRNPRRLVSATTQFGSALGSLRRLLTMSADPDTRLRGALVREKKVVWSRAIPVEQLKRIGKVTGATINGVLMTLVSGALRRYLVAHGPVPKRLNVRGVIPVNLRPIEEAHRLGNHFGVVFLDLPIGLDEPLERLVEVRKRMMALKQSSEAYVAFQILRAIGMAPRHIFDSVVSLFSRKATVVVTNVVGPRDPISLMGVPLREAMFWVPCAGRLGLGISLLSYAGDVRVGVQTDAGLVPDPERMLENFYAEIEILTTLEHAVDDHR